MTLALTKGPYIFNVNNLFTESSNSDKCKRQLLELKNGLVALDGAGVIWQVVASSNKTSVVNKGGGSPDLWSTISDVNFMNIPTHSWIILENQTTGSELLIDYAGTSHLTATVTYSPGGLFTSDGTTSTAPTATDYITILYKNYLFGNNTTLKFVLNIMTSADHKITRWYWHERNGSGWTGGMIGFIEDVQDTPSEWNSTLKAATWYHAGDVVLSANTYDKTPSLSKMNDECLRVYYETAEPYSSYLPCYPSCGGYYDFVSGNQVRTPIKINLDLGMLGGYPSSPIGLWRPQNPKGGHLGKFADLYFAPYNHNTLDTYPSNASKTWVKWGCFIVPWNGSTPTDAV